VSRDKKEARSVGRLHRTALSEDQRDQASDQVRCHLHELVEARSVKRIGLYAALGSELDLRTFAEECQSAGLTLAWPRVSGPAELAFHVLEGPDGLIPGWRGILEPPSDAPCVELTELDLLLVPGVCFDRSGARLGQGGGFYDRLLAGDAGVHTVGVAFEVQVVDAVPTGPRDVPVKGLVTERGYQDPSPLEGETP